MARGTDFTLEPDDIVGAAVAILREEGFDAVSMRSVAARLGVSPVPLYNRIGNKEALLDAMAEHLVAGIAPPTDDEETWQAYATRWARDLRSRLRAAPDSRLVLRARRRAYVQASKPLVEIMRRDGLDDDEAVRACRMLMWTTVGFVAVEQGGRSATDDRPTRSRAAKSAGRRRAPGGDPSGIGPEESDEMFDLQIRLLVDGLAAEAAADD